LSSPVNGDENPGLLWRLCKDTGGRAYSPAEDSVVSVSKNIARDLREQYTLGYATQNVERPDAFRKIEVKVMASGHGKVRVRTRQGYFLAVSSQLPTQAGSGAGCMFILGKRELPDERERMRSELFVAFYSYWEVLPLVMLVSASAIHIFIKRSKSENS